MSHEGSLSFSTGEGCLTGFEPVFSWFTARRVQPLHHRHHKKGRTRTLQIRVRAPLFRLTGAAIPGRRRGRLGFRTTEQGTRSVQPPEVRDAERAACRVWRGRQSAARPSDVFSETSLADDRPRQRARAGRTAVSSLAATTRGSRWSGQAGPSRGGQRAFPVCRCPDPTPQPANRSGRESNPHPPSSFDGVTATELAERTGGPISTGRPTTDACLQHLGRCGVIGSSARGCLHPRGRFPCSLPRPVRRGLPN